MCNDHKVNIIVRGNSYELTSQTLHSIEENSLHHLTFFLSMLRMAFLQTSFNSDIVPVVTLAILCGVELLVKILEKGCS